LADASHTDVDRLWSEIFKFRLCPAPTIAREVGLTMSIDGLVLIGNPSKCSSYTYFHAKVFCKDFCMKIGVA